jgi:hypothetical protein
MPHTLAPDVDRLPWLTDHVERPRRSIRFVGPFLAASAVAIIAALSYWIGMSGALTPSSGNPARPEASVELPPASAPAKPDLSRPEMPQVEPVLAPPPVALPDQKQVRIESPPVSHLAKRTLTVHRGSPAATKADRSQTKTASGTKEERYANPWESSGVSGRMVRVGAYSSLEAGKKAWSRLAELSPAVKQLPAVVTDLPSKSGRVYYWLQIGTTSQAHSEVLCQRMRAIRQSCVVVDLAGARKGSGDERQPVSL